MRVNKTHTPRGGQTASKPVDGGFDSHMGLDRKKEVWEK